MTGKIIGYKRVSTEDQDLNRQLHGIHLDKVFIDRASAGTTNRPKLQEMLNYMREDDIIYVHEMDRLARDNRDLLNLVHQITSSGVKIKFVIENLEFDGSDDHHAMLKLQMAGAFAEFERAKISERIKDGIAKSTKCWRKGRKRVMDSDKIAYAKERLRIGIGVCRIAREMNVCRDTLRKYLKASN